MENRAGWQSLNSKNFRSSFSCRFETAPQNRRPKITFCLDEEKVTISKTFDSDGAGDFTLVDDLDGACDFGLVDELDGAGDLEKAFDLDEARDSDCASMFSLFWDILLLFLFIQDLVFIVSI
ncbi:hypothetical protein BpHYR1_033915 [Brachionus plicatilis]|uniref:Uncharacterized protein n=1 Tax=Brachionus plicatilis TaxID=10195 RepID=A0A3M7SHJ5_BRAPC|nr:hypothetical protein BpHYR1_033915 [Brachionus plicatilis]